MERIFCFLGETKRLNDPMSAVGPFDEIKCVGKADGIKS